MKTKKIYPESYYETMGEAIDAAKLYAESCGYVVIEDNFNWGHIGYEQYQHRSYSLMKGEKESKKGLQVTLYRMPSGRYELTCYIL